MPISVTVLSQLMSGMDLDILVYSPVPIFSDSILVVRASGTRSKITNWHQSVLKQNTIKPQVLVNSQEAVAPGDDHYVSKELLTGMLNNKSYYFFMSRQLVRHGKCKV